MTTPTASPMPESEHRRMAEVEDDMWYYRALHRNVAAALASGLPPGRARVLDAGCGTGGLLRFLDRAHPEWELTGVDLAPAACALARARAGAPVLEASLTALPFATGAFDAVVSSDVICQIPDEAAAWRELARVLRPGGVAVVNLPAYGWLYSYHDRRVGNLRRYGRAQAAAGMRAAGLTVVETTHWNAAVLALVVARRKLWPAPVGSDVGRFPPVAEAVLRAVLAAESAWLRRAGALPFGSSVLTVGRKS